MIFCSDSAVGSIIDIMTRSKKVSKVKTKFMEANREVKIDRGHK